MDNNKIKSAAEIVQGVVEAVPVYEDAIQPVAKQAGEALNTAGGLVNLVLRPVKSAVIAGNMFMDRLDELLRERLAGQEADKIQAPAPNITGSIVSILPFVLDVDELRNMYVNLLGAAMHAHYEDVVHPGFGEIIKQLTPNEAAFLQYFYPKDQCPLIELRLQEVGTYGFYNSMMFCAVEGGDTFGNMYERVVGLRNMERLGLLYLTTAEWSLGEDCYEVVKNAPEYIEYIQQHEKEGKVTVGENKGLVKLTEFGKHFITICVKSPFDRGEVVS